MKKFLFLNFLTLLITLFITNTFAQSFTGSIMPTHKKFLIQSAISYNRNNEGFWERQGGGSSVNKGDNIRIWTLDGAETKRFTLVESSQKGYYEIICGPNTGYRVDVSGGKLSQNGTNIQIYTKNGTESQKFLFRHLGNGKYKIFTKEGLIVNLKTAGSSNNGNNIQIWKDHDAIHNEWYILDAVTKKPIIPEGKNMIGSAPVKGTKMPTENRFYIQSAMNYGRNQTGFLEFAGKDPSWNTTGAIMDVWTKDNNPNKLFRISKTRDAEYYTIHSASSTNGVMDCKDGKSDKGTPLQLWTISENNHAQQFYFKHLGNGRYKIYHRSGKVVCLKDNKNTNNGNRVHLWDDHNAITTEWYLIDSSTGKLIMP